MEASFHCIMFTGAGNHAHHSTQYKFFVKSNLIPMKPQNLDPTENSHDTGIATCMHSYRHINSTLSSFLLLTRQSHTIIIQCY